jgi:hypothetical protein
VTEPSLVETDQLRAGMGRQSLLVVPGLEQDTRDDRRHTGRSQQGGAMSPPAPTPEVSIDPGGQVDDLHLFRHR